jgi:hypothetical protein
MHTVIDAQPPIAPALALAHEPLAAQVGIHRGNHDHHHDGVDREQGPDPRQVDSPRGAEQERTDQGFEHDDEGGGSHDRCSVSLSLKHSILITQNYPCLIGCQISLVLDSLGFA